MTKKRQLQRQRYDKEKYIYKTPSKSDPRDMVSGDVTSCFPSIGEKKH